MISRDINFRNSLKKGNKKYGRSVDRKINNAEDIEQLQEIADNIYSEQIESIVGNRKVETIREKYGGYKIEPVVKSLLENDSKAIQTDFNLDSK